MVQGLFDDLKNEIEFEDWYDLNLKHELGLKNEFLKYQIFNLIYQYIETSYLIS